METSYSKALYDCALECALLRKNRKCKNKFRSERCYDCRYFIGNYIDAEPRQMELFEMQAELSAGSIKATSGNHHIVFIVLILICLLLSWFTYTQEKEMDSFFPDKPATSVAIKVKERDEITTTLYKVAQDLNHGVDVNKDGLVNCIDAAVLFYQYYPDKGKVTIELNQNSNTGMHHLFNCVLIDGVWRAIEPQAVQKNNWPYFMRDIWGTRYDSKYNKDVTSDYLKYVRR